MDVVRDPDFRGYPYSPPEVIDYSTPTIFLEVIEGPFKREAQKDNSERSKPTTRPEKKLTRLEHELLFLKALGARVLKYAGVEVDPIDALYQDQVVSPQTLKQKAIEKRVLKKARALKPMIEVALNVALAREDAPAFHRQVEITSQWVNYQKRLLKNKLKAGKINLFEYGEGIDQLKSIKPKRVFKIFKQPYAPKLYRPRGTSEEEARVPRSFWSWVRREDTVTWPPITAYEKKLYKNVQKLEESLKSVGNTEAVERKIARLKRS